MKVKEKKRGKGREKNKEKEKNRERKENRKNKQELILDIYRFYWRTKRLAPIRFI